MHVHGRYAHVAPDGKQPCLKSCTYGVAACPCACDHGCSTWTCACSRGGQAGNAMCGGQAGNAMCGGLAGNAMCCTFVGALLTGAFTDAGGSGKLLLQGDSFVAFGGLPRAGILGSCMCAACMDPCMSKDRISDRLPNGLCIVSTTCHPNHASHAGLKGMLRFGWDDLRGSAHEQGSQPSIIQPSHITSQSYIPCWMLNAEV